MRRISSQMWRQLCGVASCVEDLASLRRSGKPLLGGEELYRAGRSAAYVWNVQPSVSGQPGRRCFPAPADPLAAVFQLRRLCEHRSIPAEAGSSVVPPTVSESAPARPHRTSSPAPSPAAQVSRGHFVVGVVFGLLGSGGETLTAGWPIVSWAGAESSEWMALALLVSVLIRRVGQICTGHWAAGPGRGMLHPQ